jgi:hypothetical protein
VTKALFTKIVSQHSNLYALTSILLMAVVETPNKGLKPYRICEKALFLTNCDTKLQSLYTYICFSHALVETASKVLELSVTKALFITNVTKSYISLNTSICSSQCCSFKLNMTKALFITNVNQCYNHLTLTSVFSHSLVETSSKWLEHRVTKTLFIINVTKSYNH